ncbi:permeability factor 2-like [Grammomys surdaster]|uniref:permeability factor 2-like n=1 Tax=Grammomys surdaster TaxID=491861 RepID=UPI0010A09211|nr:permeability factor 2-like [Grammomys surdaster]
MVHPHIDSPGSVFSTMAFRLRPTSSCTRASPLQNLQVLLLLLLVALAPLTVGKPNDMDPYLELRCRCTNTVSGIPLNSISLVNVFRPGVHCANVEVIATLKNGEKRCLDPTAPVIQKIVMKILNGY